ncbi:MULTISPECIES: hypothetical protein [Streptomyces]|uniref:Uncharacterized protein n=1 Tax=Streptomyces sudanensis TaxID=436397 RepID=A0ABY4TDH8_9ACTN|nr:MULTISPECIES: hypothetical protein [Streptomyces]URN16992.1 hypothetical protein MW084_14825 [Streptomyces sudanensis]
MAMPLNAEEIAEAIEAELEICRRPLRDFQANDDDREGFARSGKASCKFPVDPSKIPVPLIAAMTFRVLLRCHDLGRAEKLAWEYPFIFRGRECSISLEKFGTRIYVGKTTDGDASSEKCAREIVGKVAAAGRMMEKNLLSLMGQQALALGNVTVPNLYYKLQGMYKYFREAALEAYAGNGLLARASEREDSGTLIAGKLNHFMAVRREGLYATVAMVNAYFSLLEHTLVLTLPSTDFNPRQESVASFIGSRLFEKYDRIFSGNKNKQAQRLREKLKEVAEVWRNPYSHGGFDKMHQAVGFHVEGIGVIPVGLSNVTNMPEFHIFPERDQGFDELCTLFDEIDDFLCSGPLWASLEWVKYGLDVPLDEESLKIFRGKVSEGEAEFRDHLSRTSAHVEQAMNMDW